MVLMPATLVTVLPIGGIMMIHGTLSSDIFIQVVILAMGLITPIINIMSYQDDIAKLNTVLAEITGILNSPEMERPEAPESHFPGSAFHSRAAPSPGC